MKISDSQREIYMNILLIQNTGENYVRINTEEINSDGFKKNPNELGKNYFKFH
jgi:hypothetical protein